MLKRIDYISRFSKPLSHAEIDALAEQAERTNESLGITGLLMTTGGIFYQILEGPSEEVDRLFSRIMEDPRHTDVLVLSMQEAVEDRYFPAWSMKKVNLDGDSMTRLEPIKALLEAIMEQRSSLQRMLQIISRAVWREIVNES
jgi:adenylate cyclase